MSRRAATPAHAPAARLRRQLVNGEEELSKVKYIAHMGGRSLRDAGGSMDAQQRGADPKLVAAVLFTRGNEAQERGDLAAAVGLYKRAISLNAAEAAYYSARALAFRKLFLCSTTDDPDGPYGCWKKAPGMTKTFRFEIALFGVRMILVWITFWLLFHFDDH